MIGTGSVFAPGIVGRSKGGQLMGISTVRRLPRLSPGKMDGIYIIENANAHLPVVADSRGKLLKSCSFLIGL